ncbi:PKD domain-containing protein [Pseudopedobacter sp.]|uniref:PKD domain-containing protein n=1 Tax=Pseudopedobacter sp. TaxID=1936787 RepID=UPI00334290E5
MRKAKNLLLLSFAIFLFAKDIFAQSPVAGDTIPAKLIYKIDNEKITFDSELRPLRAIAGAPAPFYSYFWEFGDGNFSFLQNPTHIYADSGTYAPRLYATNNYDDGNPPPTRPGKLKIKSKPAARTMLASTNFFKDNHQISLQSNRMPKPQEEMILILGYKNNALANPLSKSGTIALFYNDIQFDKDNFKISEIRTHHKEERTTINQLLALGSTAYSGHSFYAKSGPNMLFSPAQNSSASKLIQEQKTAFRSVEAWKYSNLQSNEERFMFISLQTTPEMIRDTNAVVNLSAVFIPDDPLADIDIYKLELQIVASHDPNKMILKNRTMNYRFLGKEKTLTYKVRFQNTGKGPAKKVDVGVSIPDVLDIQSVKIKDSSPKVTLCDSAYTGQSCLDTIVKKDSIHFVFRNIYLPGVQQDGVNNKDSTKGYIEYQIKFKEKPKKLPFASSAGIIFDKNEPIYTNKANGKFKPGISPGIMVGYGFSASKNPVKGIGEKNYTVGFSISPYSPFRKFLQAELFLNAYEASNDLINTIDYQRDTTYSSGTADRASYMINGRSIYHETQKVNLDIVPIHLRYNLNHFVGLGLGTFTSLTLSEKTRILQRTFIEERIFDSTGNTKEPDNIFQDDLYIDTKKKTFSALNASIFADLQLGLVRKGPALGIRYLRGINNKDNRIFTYLSFKL